MMLVYVYEAIDFAATNGMGVLSVESERLVWHYVPVPLCGTGNTNALLVLRCPLISIDDTGDVESYSSIGHLLPADDGTEPATDRGYMFNSRTESLHIHKSSQKTFVNLRNRASEISSLER